MNQYIDNTISWLNGEVDELTNTKSVKGTWTELTGKRLQYYQEQITDDPVSYTHLPAGPERI